MRFLINYVNEVADTAKAESNDGMNCPVVWTVASARRRPARHLPDDEVLAGRT